MDALVELVSVCRAADTDKITERKKQIERLSRLVIKPNVIHALDINSDLHGKKSFSWHSLFKIACNLIWREDAALKKAKDVCSATSQKKKQEVCALLKLIVRQADKRGKRLKSIVVVSHILDVMKDEFTRSIFGMDLTSILLKDILSNYKHQCELSSKIWHDLIHLYLHQLVKVSNNTDRLVFARVTHMAMQAAVRQCDIKGRKILPLLQEYFSKIKQESSMAVIEHMVSTLNLLCLHIAVESRFQICRLGEQITIPLLYIWSNKRPSESLKEQLVQLLQLQMAAHHPNGTKTTEEGAFAVNWDMWKGLGRTVMLYFGKDPTSMTLTMLLHCDSNLLIGRPVAVLTNLESNLRKIYEAIYCDLEELGNRSKFSSGGREIVHSVLKDNFISLAADVCHQIFEDTSSVVEITQASFMQNGTQPSGPCKKRRLETGWEIVREKIQAQALCFTVIPWVQLVTNMTQKYPGAIPESELVPLLTIIQKTCADSRKLDITRYLLRCLCTFVKGYKQMKKNITDFTVDAIEIMWQKVWKVSLRFVSLHHAEAEGFQLLSDLLKEHLVTPDNEVWNLFLPTHSPLSDQAVNFLISCLRYLLIPENYKSNVIVTLETGMDSGYPLRHQLLTWAFPHKDQLTSTESSHILSLDPILMADLLARLTFRHCDNIDYELDKQCSGKQMSPDLKFCADVFLRTKFNIARIPDLSLSNTNRDITKQISVIHYVTEFLDEMLCSTSQNLMDTSDPDVQDIEVIAWHCVLIAGILRSRLVYNVATLNDLQSTKLTNALQKMLKRLTLLMIDNFKKKSLSCIGNVISLLDEILKWEGTPLPDTTSRQLQIFCSSLIPRELVRHLIDYLVEKAQSRHASALSTSKAAGMKSNRNNERDKFDMGFDDLGFDDPMDTMDTDLGFDDVDDNDKIDDFSISSDADSDGLLSFKHLSEDEKFSLEAVKFLCHYCLFGKTNDSEIGNGIDSSKKTQKDDIKRVKRKLFGLLGDEAEWDVNKTFDIHLLHLLIEEMLVKHDHFEDEYIEVAVDTVKTVCSNHRKDQVVCMAQLHDLMTLIPLMAANTTSSALEDTRDLALHLLRVFWKLTQDNQYSAETRSVVGICMKEFIKNDPERKWTHWPSDESDENQRLIEEYPNLLKDPHHRIRMGVTDQLKILFTPSTLPYNREEQDLMFDNVYNILQETINFQGRYSPDEQQDEIQNRTCTCLHTMTSIACYSAVCEKKAIFGCCQMQKEHNFDPALVIKSLTEVATELNYADLKSLMSCHICYLLSQWLDNDYVIADFPHRLMGYDKQVDFLRDNYKVIVPNLIIHNKSEEVQQLAEQLHVERDELIDNSIPRILCYVLPYYAANGNLDNDEFTVQKRHIHPNTSKLVSVVRQESIERYIVDHLDEVVVNVLLLLHDRVDAGRKHENPYVRSFDPEPNPPWLDSNSITATLEYLTKGHGTKAKSLVSLLAKTQDGIQKVLLSLATRLRHEHRPHECCRILQAYTLFVNLLLQEFHQQLGGSWAFVLRDITFMLLHTIRSVDKSSLSQPGYETDITYLACDLLHNLCKEAVTTCPEELGRFLSPITSVLIEYASGDNLLQKKCLHLLHMLLVDNASILRDAITLLDPLPDQPIFHEAKQVYEGFRKSLDGSGHLEQEILHFLDAGGQYGQAVGRSRVEGLQSLLDHMATSKQELAELINKYDTDNRNHIGSSKTRNVLVHLVYQLVQLSQSSDKGTAGAAGKCLGELGPVDLSVVTLRNYEHTASLKTALSTYDEDMCEMRAYCHIFHKLDRYLVDPSITTVAAASGVLKKILATRTGIEFYGDYKARVGDHLFQYLHPFRSSRKRVQALGTASVSENVFVQVIDDESLWCPSHDSHSHWIRQLASKLIQHGGLQDEILRLLAPVCEVKAEFAEMILSFVVHNILISERNYQQKVLSRQFCSFFERHCGFLTRKASRSTTPLPQSDITTYIYQKKESVQVMLNVVQYLRLQTKPVEGRAKIMTAWENNFWLDLDYLLVAKAAQTCSSHFTTVLYSEIWCDIQRSKSSPPRKDIPSSSKARNSQKSQSQSSTLADDSQGSNLGLLSSLRHPGGSVSPNELMLDAYRRIDDLDGVYGCGVGRMADTSSRIETYEHEGCWSKALNTYDLAMNQACTVDMQTGILKAMKHFGSLHVLDMYLKGLNHSAGDDSSSEIKEFQYQAALNSCTWNIEAQGRLDDTCGYNEAFYVGMCSLKENDINQSLMAVNQARFSALKGLEECSLESVHSIYPVLTKLKCVQQLAQLISSCDNTSAIGDILQKWRKEDVIPMLDFDQHEPILQQRCVMLKLLEELKPTDISVRRARETHLTQLARLSRQAAQFQITERTMWQLHQLQNICEKSVAPWRLEEAWLYWARGEQNMAKQLMKTLIEQLQKIQDGEQTQAARDTCMLYPQCLDIYGNWLAESRSESPQVIIRDYLTKATDLLRDMGSQEETSLDAYFSLARYADAQYQNIEDHMKSTTYEAKIGLIKKAKEDAEKLKQIGESGSRYWRTLEKQRLIDEKELSTMEKDRDDFLKVAIRNYFQCLQCGDRHDLRIFRLTSLWFNNSSAGKVNKIFQMELPRVKSSKFLPLMYQLAARISLVTSDKADMFPVVLDQLIERTVLDHPHHTLFIILALAHANKDTEVLQTKSGRKPGGRLGRLSSSQSQTQEEERVLAAKAMVTRLRGSHRSDIVIDMERLCVAYIQLANWNVDQYKKEKKAITFPSSISLIQLKNLTNVALPTVDLKVDPTCQYNNIVYIKGFASTFKLAGGINLPKIISCVGSDGVDRRQLVKGRDDLRQDAVMQQVFGMVNNLLQKEPTTHKRRLTVRTYKVIPLSQRSGVLEWCEGTIPMGEYLIGGEGAHSRYRPQDWKALECRTELAKSHTGESSISKLDMFMRIGRHFQPVFRHFFMENFPDPVNWYERRLAYTRSVATNSIVGYIVGLGDRHVQNILIDCQTAELIHIDLGVAFEQGKILPTPETVPFRLTRDIVDGMGVAGVEGVFRRCCEKTMEVMHQSHEALLTILQVLLHDPLYAWTISPEKAYKLQQQKADMDGAGDANTSTRDILDIEENRSSSENRENVNKVAERVLLRLEQKLGGVESGVRLSVSGQVNHLIQEAKDPVNLCRVFPGWQPYI